MKKSTKDEEFRLDLTKKEEEGEVTANDLQYSKDEDEQGEEFLKEIREEEREEEGKVIGVEKAGDEGSSTSLTSDGNHELHELEKNPLLGPEDRKK